MELGIIADLSDINVDFIYNIENVIGNSRDIYNEYKVELKEKTQAEVDEYFKQFGI